MDRFDEWEQALIRDWANRDGTSIEEAIALYESIPVVPDEPQEIPQLGDIFKDVQPVRR